MASKDRIAREKNLLKQQRKKEIYEAAESLFLEKGFQKTTIGDIAKACELTNGAIYIYYKNKDILILSVMINISERFGDLFEEAENQGKTGAEKVRDIFSVYNKTVKEFVRYHFLDAEFNAMFNEAYPESPLLQDYYKANRRVLHILGNACSLGLADGSLRVCGLNQEKTGDQLAGMLLNAINSYVEKISLRKALMEREQEIDLTKQLAEYLDFIVGALSCP